MAPPRIDLPVEEIVARYKAGESTCKLARVYGVAQGTIQRRLWAAGVKMRTPGFFLPGNQYGRRGKGRHRPGGPLCDDGSGYLRTYDRERKLCRIHRGCWEAYNGLIPNAHVIHHIDDNREDNAIENLACMMGAEHTRLHSEKEAR